MARSLIDYLLNPFINIVLYFLEKDLFKNYFIYFILTELICLVMSFFGYVFNEYIILYFCCLELETKDEIRAIDSESQAQNELKDIFSNIDNEDNIRKSSTIISIGDYDSEI